MAVETNIESGARARILEAAWTLLLERGVGAVSMGEIAAAAEVSRQAVYLHFANRAGLLVAVTRHHDDGSRHIARMRALLATPPKAAQLFEEFFDAWLGYVPEIFPVARKLSAAAATDPEAAQAWDSRMESLHAGIGAVMKRLKAENLLRTEWTVRTATDWTWSQTHIDVWRHLVAERGWTPMRAKAQIMRTLRTALLHEPKALARRRSSRKPPPSSPHLRQRA